MTTPDVESLNQLPKGQRRYVGQQEIPDLRKKGLRIYEGEKGGTYVDATQEWLNAHAQKGHEIVQEGNFKGLSPHPEHGHDVYEYENGDKATAENAPRDKNGKALKKKKDEHGNDVIVEQKQAKNRGHQTIPKDAKDVHVSLDPDAETQAKWRHPTTGEMQYSYHPEYQKKLKQLHWDEYAQNTDSLDEAMEKLKDMGPEDLVDNPTDTCLALVGTLGIRHGKRGEVRKHEDGGRTGIGAISLIKDEVKVEGDTVTLDFRGKHDRNQHFSFEDAALAHAISQQLEGKEGTDRVFDTTEAKNTARLRELAGNNKVIVKDLRTHVANKTAKEMAEKLPKPTTDAEFQDFQQRVGLFVGEALGHYKEQSVRGSDGKVMRDANNNIVKETVHHGQEAIDSYISPDFWDGYKPQGDIQKAHTPDWHEKTPLEERDIDEYAEARKRKGENRQWGIREFGGQRKPLVKTWMQSLNEQGFIAPVIKQTNAGQMWFLNNGIDYVGTLGMNGEVFVEKATFKPTFNNPGISYNPAGRNKDVKTREPRKDVETLNFDESDDF